MRRFSLFAGRRVVLSSVAWGLVALAAVPAVRAELTPPSSKDRQVARSVTLMLDHDHVSQRPLDNEMSERFLKTFLDSLDPLKLYFYQSDIDEFNKSKDDLDDQVKQGDVKFAYTVFNTFLARIDERVKLAEQLLDTPQDFTVDEEMITDADSLSYPKDEAEARDRWRKRVKYDLLVLKTRDKMDEAAAVKKLHRRYRSLGLRMHQFDSTELLEKYLTALTTSYDPHTAYWSPDTKENFEIQMRLQLAGIGAALQSEDGDTVVSKLIPGGPADKSGLLKKKDQVVAVAQGLDGGFVDVVDMKLSDVVAMIRGKADTVVRLKVLRPGETEPLVVPITRAQVELSDGAAQGKIFEAGKKADGAPYKVGVIELPSFYMDMNAARLGRQDYRSTTRDVSRLIDDFRTKGVDAVVLDLRYNGGGALDEAVKLTGLFIDRGPVVQIKNSQGEVESYLDRDRGALWDGPLVVMINKFSASASEIVAGAIQDYGRGLVVGDTSTHGKGSVQSLKDLAWELFRDPQQQFGALKITMQQFYRPSGESTQNRGVVSDIELPSVISHLPIGEADLPFALPFDKVEAAGFENLHRADAPLVQQLRVLSSQRTHESPDFKNLQVKIERYLAQKERKSITLNEEKFKKDLDAGEEEEKHLEEIESADKSTIERDYYLDEALNITTDYVRLTEGARPLQAGVAPK